jgi:PAS domain S-box-containing protein
MDGSDIDRGILGHLASWAGPVLTALAILALATAGSISPRAPLLVLLLLAVALSTALGGWRSGAVTAGLVVAGLAWLWTRGTFAATGMEDRAWLWSGLLLFPAAIAVGFWVHGDRGGRPAAPPAASIPPAPDPEENIEQAENERFRQLVIQVEGFAIFMLDASGHNRTWNEGVERLLGYGEREWIGQPAAQIFTPEDRARDMPRRELRHAEEHGQASDDRWLLRKDGSRFFAAGLTTALRDRRGRLIGFSKVFRDRTDAREAEEARAESEARLRVALQAARMGIWRYHIPTDRQLIDNSMAPLLGLDGAERIETFEQFLQHIHADDRDRVATAFHQAATTGENMDVEFRVVWPDGAVHWLSDHGQVVRDAAGAPEYLTGAAVDVTERKTAEAKLVQSQRMDAVGQLAGGVAHEVNNMMQAVLGYTALLIGGLGRRKTDRSDLLHIQRAAERTATITRQLLAFSRRQVIHPQALSLNQIVREMEPILRRSLGEDRELRLDLGDGPTGVWADRGSMEQVILNLALNARDAMAMGGTLTVQTHEATIPGNEEWQERRLAPGRYTVLVLSDTGAGMDEITRARAFEPFFTTKPVGQGTGLGLAMVQGIVEQSEGAIRLSSEPGSGTTVELYFPAVSLPPLTGGTPPEIRQTLPAGSGIVVVVEDEDLVRDFVCRSLEELGYTCWPAANAMEAMATVSRQSTPPDLLITDLVMPGSSGRDLAEWLLGEMPGLPVLFISAYSADEVVRRGLLAPGANYLQKPFPLETLALAVRGLLATQSAANSR